MTSENGKPYRPPDYSVLDRPDVLSGIFFPKEEWTVLPPGAQDFMVPVEDSVLISARYYPASTDSPNIIFFHGNAEVACDYDQIARAYNQLDIGLFVADYRGFGKSGGHPTFSHMVADSSRILEFFLEEVRPEAAEPGVFVMGRSMGCISALELASKNPEALSGLIVDSGLADVGRLASRFGFPRGIAEELSKNVTNQVRHIKTPALIIHGEFDTLIPLVVGMDLYDNLDSQEKSLVVIPGGDHNNLLYVGAQRYFSAISGFVSKNS